MRRGPFVGGEKRKGTRKKRVVLHGGGGLDGGEISPGRNQGGSDKKRLSNTAGKNSVGGCCTQLGSVRERHWGRVTGCFRKGSE